MATTGEKALAQARTVTNMAIDDTSSVLRRLLPFPASADESLLQVPLIPLKGSIVPDRTIPGSGEAPAIQQAATIVSDAAAILDEEMARGELAARAVGPAPHHPDPDQGGRSCQPRPDRQRRPNLADRPEHAEVLA